MATREMRQERSVSVQGRVDIVKLAEVFASLEMNKYNIRTMSLLISYCVDITHSALEQNGLLDKRFEGGEKIGHAYHLLIDSGVMTRATAERNKKKVNMAWGFENIREEGGDPSIEAPGYYKMMHNHRSVQVPDDRATKAKALEMLEYADSVQKQKDAEETEKRMIARKQKYNLDENGAIIPKSVITPKLECPVPATDIPDEAATTKPIEQPIDNRSLGEKLKSMTYEERKAFIYKIKANHAQEVKNAEIIEREKERLLRKETRKNQKEQIKQVIKDSDVPRLKTDEELIDEGKRIKDKDADLMARLDANIIPTRTSKDGSDEPTVN